MDNKTIYVVTKGSYSDYHILTATTDEAKARAVATLCSDKYENAEIEEYSDDYELEMDSKYIYHEKTGQLDRYPLYSGLTFWQGNDIYGAKGMRTVVVAAKDEDHARKKIYDMLAKDNAERLGL